MAEDRGFGITMICETCLTWQRHPNDPSMGKCRYSAPAAFSTEDGHYDGEWPTTWSDDWCGKWMPSPAVSPFGRVDPDVRHAVEDVRINRGPSEVES